MGLLDEMTTYLDLEMPERDSLLEKMKQYEDGKPFYMAGQRPLNSSKGEESFAASPKIGHHHFILNDGKGNFGFTDTGYFVEPPEALYEYEPTKKYGMKRYEANLLDLALKNWSANHDAVDEVADNMDLWEEGMSDRHRDYHPIANNCQHFVSWLDKEHDRLAANGYK